MADRAGSPVPHHTDTKVIDLVAFPQKNIFPVSHGITADPGPVSGLHDLFGAVLMAFEAGLCDRLGGIKFIFEIRTVVQVRYSPSCERIFRYRHRAVIVPVVPGTCAGNKNQQKRCKGEPKRVRHIL